MSNISSIAKITDYLYLCGARAITRQRMKNLGITDVINCTSDVPNRTEPGVKTVQIAISDHPLTQVGVHFDQIADLIHSVKAQGRKVLVHCVAGISRSATICIAYFMKHHKMSLLDAHYYVWSRRRIIRPNIGFWKQLISYEGRLHQKNTVRLVNTTSGPVPHIYLYS